MKEKEGNQLLEVTAGKPSQKVIGRNFGLCGYCPHNSGVSVIEGEVSVELTPAGVADAVLIECSGEFVPKAFAVNGPVGAAQLELGRP
jgi:hypothetical protein